jgi:hypothetical protein
MFTVARPAAALEIFTIDRNSLCCGGQGKVESIIRTILITSHWQSDTLPRALHSRLLLMFYHILGAFANLRKATISFVMEQLFSVWTDFHEIWYFGIFSKYVCPENSKFIKPLNAELNPICHLLMLLGDLTFMGPCIVSIFQHISNKMQRYTVYLYLETALHVPGGTSTGLSVLWVAYATHSTLKSVPTLPR